MAFMKDFIIYKKGEIKVYINQCHNKGKKTKLFAVRRDDKTGLAYYIGSIKWYGVWRQYIFFPEKETFWSRGCLKEIINFLEKINKKNKK